MKRVFTNSNDVIHLFAQQTQTDARANNVFFNNTTKLYSYGHHYLLAEVLPSNTIIINDSGYSVTTSKHISQVRYATRQFSQFFITEIDIDNVVAEIERLKGKLANARKPEIYINEIFSRFEALTQWMTYTKVNRLKHKHKLLRSDSKFKKLERFYDALRNDSSNIKEKLHEQATKERKLKIAKDKRELKVALKKFNNYESSSFRIGSEDYLRVSEDGTKIESSQGIRIDIEEGRKLYRAIEKGIDVKGHRVDNYTVKSLNGVLTIGCHSINVVNMHKVGKSII